MNLKHIAVNYNNNIHFFYKNLGGGGYIPYKVKFMTCGGEKFLFNRIQ
jgi:hypothetical protein